METGCYFVPRPAPGICRRDTQSSKVDDRCVLSEKGCELKTNQEPNQEPPKENIIKVPTAKSVALSQSFQSFRPSPSLDPGRLNGKISGPISAYINGQINSGDQKYDQKYMLFGDLHNSLGNNCGVCQDISINNLSPINIDNNSCTDISFLLTEIFEKARLNKEYVDFYLEIPFIPRGTKGPSKTFLQQAVKRLGYMYKLYYIFNDCFNKTNCQYDNVRFHYVDVRLKYKIIDMKSMLDILKSNIGDVPPEIMEKIPKNVPETYETDVITFEKYLTIMRIPKVIDILTNMIRFDDRSPQKYIENTDKLMKATYYSQQTLVGLKEPGNSQLFDIYLTSDNFPEAVKQLYQNSLDNIEESKDLLEIYDHLLVPSLIVNRKGKSMHKIRAQLEALEMENKQELADKIVNYLKSEFRSRVVNKDIIQIWDKIIKLYRDLTQSKFRSLGDIEIFKNQIIRDYQIFDELTVLSVDSNSLLMDAYLLARMFRSFPGSNHIDSKTKIIYAGDAHISNYVKFLETLGNDFYKFNPNQKYIDDISIDNIKRIKRCVAVNKDLFL